MNASFVSSIALVSIGLLPVISVADQSIEGQLLDAPGPGYHQQANQLPLSQINVVYKPKIFKFKSFSIFDTSYMDNVNCLTHTIERRPIPVLGKQIKPMPSFHNLLNNYELLNMIELTPWLTNHWSER